MDPDERRCADCRHRRKAHGISGSPCNAERCSCRNFVCAHDEVRQPRGAEVGHRAGFICVFCSTDVEERGERILIFDD